MASSNRRAPVAVALACAVSLAAGCSGSAPPASPPSPAPPGTTSREQAADRYLVIAQAGNRRLEVDFDRLARRDRARLGAARADLADAAATERLFDRRLAAIPFGTGTGAIARLLIQLNQTRANLTVSAARSTTLGQLRSWQARLNRSNATVEEAVQLIRSQLGLPPPSSS